VGEHICGGDIQPIALMLGDSACADWFDFSEFPWEFACMLPMERELSAYGALQRMGMVPMVFGTAAPEAYGFRTDFTFHDMMEYARNYQKYRPSFTPRTEGNDASEKQ
jgi:hypothetical protein